MKIKKIINLSIFSSLLFWHKIAKAASIVTPKEDGNYQVNDFILLAVNISSLILRVVGSLALLFFVYGGLTLMLSGGSSEQVKKGQGIIKAAVIGLIIVFASFIIIKFALQTIGIDWTGGTVSF
jgi:hypothetical protein